MTDDDFLASYTTPGIFTHVTGFEQDVDRLPADVAAITEAVQGLVMHHAWAPAYSVTLSAERVAEQQLHGADAMLRCASQHDTQPVIEARAAEHRVAGVCRHFATLFVAFARRKGIAARARCGFADYFERGKHVEHWVGEYWADDKKQWVLVDAQIDPVQSRVLRLKFDPLDVPRDRFLVAGDAWHACRNGSDAMTFGVGGSEMWGLVEVFGEVLQDLAALQNIELLPWTWYGLATDKSAMRHEVELIDRLAAISSDAGEEAIATLRRLGESDERLHVPDEMLERIVAAERQGVRNEEGEP